MARDAVLYAIVGRAAPMPIFSCDAKDPDLVEKMAEVKLERRRAARASGVEIKFEVTEGDE